jgi:hypothetical protein
MPPKGTSSSFRLVLAVVAAAFAFSPYVRASGFKCNCEPSTAVYHSPFFGYYPTCWRQFPPGQPQCPSAPTAPTAEPTRVSTKERTIELLPLPRPEPEEPEKK